MEALRIRISTTSYRILMANRSRTSTMTLVEIRTKQHRQLLRARNINRIIGSEAFAAAFELATEEQRERFQEAIDSGNQKALLAMIKSLRCKDYGTYSLRELRELGHQLDIKYSSRKDKATLLSEIVQREQSKSSTRCHSGYSGTPFVYA